jgi:hypothetical protein
VTTSDAGAGALLENVADAATAAEGDAKSAAAAMTMQTDARKRAK